MGRVVMIGGVFLVARDPKGLAAWYGRHLGLDPAQIEGDESWYTVIFFRDDDRPERRLGLAFSIMAGDPGEAGSGHIINYRVDDIESVLASLQADGIEVSPVTVGDDGQGEGKFARLDDPEGHRIELWEHISAS